MSGVGRHQIDHAVASAGGGRGQAALPGPSGAGAGFSEVTARSALFLLVEGAQDGAGDRLFNYMRASIRRDRGTPSSRLHRAVRDACRGIEQESLHRHELAGLGLSALLVEEGSAYLAQLLPAQAYVVEDGAVRPFPEAQMEGASRVASESGRKWEVELEVARISARPGAAFVLCAASLERRLSAARVLDAVRRPAPDAASSLAAHGGGAAGDDVVVARLVGTAETPRARLFPIRERRAAPRPLVPSPRGGAQRIEAWGLRGETRTALRGRLGDPLPAVGRRRRRRGAAWLMLPALGSVGAAGYAWTVLRSRLTRTRKADGEFPGGDPAPAGPAEPPPGTLLLASGEPFISLAVAAGQPRVLDAGGRISALGGPPSAGASGEARLVAIAARETDAVALDGARTIWRVGEGAEPARPVALRAASLWQRPHRIATYTGNLYVLDLGAPGAGGQIWRHAAGGSGGFDGEAQAWLAPSASVGLDGATDMAIDGAIWISRADGTVLRLSAGRPEPFQPRGLDTPIVNAGAIFADRALPSVYVLDAAGRRLIRMSKEGQVEGVLPEALPLGEHARGLWVDPGGRRALVLTESRLAEVTLA